MRHQSNCLHMSKSNKKIQLLYLKKTIYIDMQLSTLQCARFRGLLHILSVLVLAQS